MKGKSFYYSKWKIFLNDLHMCIPKLTRNFLIMGNTVIFPYAETLPWKLSTSCWIPQPVRSGWVILCWGLQFSLRWNQMQDFKHVVQPEKETSWITNRKKDWFSAVFRISYPRNLVGRAAKEPFSLMVLSASWATHGLYCYRKANFSLFTCVASDSPYTFHTCWLDTSWCKLWLRQTYFYSNCQSIFCPTCVFNNFSFYNVASHIFLSLTLKPSLP